MHIRIWLPLAALTTALVSLSPACVESAREVGADVAVTEDISLATTEIDPVPGALWESRRAGGILSAGAALADGGVLVCGQQEVESSGTDIWLTRYDADGTVVWEKTWGGDDKEECISVVEAGGHIFVVARVVDGDGVESQALLKFGSDGTSLVNVPLEWDFQCSGPECLTAMDDGTLLAVGELRFSMEGQADGGYALFDAGCMRTDTWMVESGDDDTATATAVTPDGSRYIVGSSMTSGEDKGEALIIRLGPGGALSFNLNLGTKDMDDEAYDLVALPDDTIAVAGATEMVNGGQGIVWVFIMNAEGDVLMETKIVALARARGITLLPDGALLVVGNVIKSKGDTTFVTKLSTEGEILESFFIGGLHNDEVAELVTGADGSVYWVGNMAPTLTGRAAWVVRLH
jgi:hypothetical protein